MAVNIVPPNANQPIVYDNGIAILRTNLFFVELTKALAGIADEGTAVADITVSTTANNTAKINELMAVLRTAGVIAT